MYAFGSNSSSQLAMGSTDKFLQATKMDHFADAQFVSTCISHQLQCQLQCHKNVMYFTNVMYVILS